MRFPIDYICITEDFNKNNKTIKFSWNYADTKSLVIRSVFDGTIYKLAENTVYIKHDQGLISCYSNLPVNNTYKIGDEIKMGEVITKLNDIQGYFIFSMYADLNCLLAINPLLCLYVYPDQFVEKNTAILYRLLYFEKKWSYEKKNIFEYLVKRMDKLVDIAIKYNVSLDSILQANILKYPSITKEKIMPGWVLDIPNNEYIYNVVKGDCLSKIARDLKVKWQVIYEENKELIGADPNLIKVGQQLIIRN